MGMRISRIATATSWRRMSSRTDRERVSGKDKDQTKTMTTRSSKWNLSLMVSVVVENDGDGVSSEGIFSVGWCVPQDQLVATGAQVQVLARPVWPGPGTDTSVQSQSGPVNCAAHIPTHPNWYKVIVIVHILIRSVNTSLQVQQDASQGPGIYWGSDWGLQGGVPTVWHQRRRTNSGIKCQY